MTHDAEPQLTDEEGVVLAVTMRHAPCSPEDVKRYVDRHYGSLISLELKEIEAILRRLEARGLVVSGVQED